MGSNKLIELLEQPTMQKICALCLVFMLHGIYSVVHFCEQLIASGLREVILLRDKKINMKNLFQFCVYE